jgi:signal transduction histidine kinase
MSHELRTPLNAIIGFSDIIRTRSVGPASDKYAEYAGFINESGNHLLALISGVLELAKIESGKKAVHDHDVDVAVALVDAVENARAAATERELTIEATLPPALPHLRADATAVREILYQLLSNAVKFTPPSGFVKAGAELTASGELAIVVADTGIGIGSEDQAQMFDRFGRGQHDVARANAGAGLGLPIVKGLIDLHGGRVSLASAPGEGTRVTVFFPAERVAAPPRLAAAG